MAIHVCVTAAAIFLGAAVGGAADVLPRDRTSLIATHETLVGVGELSVTLTTEETPQAGKVVDISKLRAELVTKLKDAGIKHVEGEPGACPRLVVQIEAVTVPDCDKCICRVQTSMNRTVIVTAHRDMQVEAEVWRLRPAIKVTAGNEAGRVITDAVIAQVEAFIDAYESARKLQARVAVGEPNAPGAASSDRAKPNPLNLQAVSLVPFVASRSGSVFHRPNCRWAQNISGDNRLGYKTREEAVQAGKRPCKTCQP